MLTTGFAHPLIGLNQWPSVSADWQAGRTETSAEPRLLVRLHFDAAAYEGLYKVVVESPETVILHFTQALDPTAAATLDNYALSQLSAPDSADERTMVVSAAVLSLDSRSVTLTVDKLAEDAELLLTLTIHSLATADQQLTFAGTARFFPTADHPGSTPVSARAAHDQRVYQQLWGQLTDENGIELALDTSLLLQPVVLTAEHVTKLLDTWLTPIMQFLADRAAGELAWLSAAPTLSLTLPLDLAQVNAALFFQLTLALRIERQAEAMAPGSTVPSGIHRVSTAIAPRPDAAQAGPTPSFSFFAEEFEQTLHVPGSYALRVATGPGLAPDSAANSFWVIRHEAGTAPAYHITNLSRPDVFAPAPLSTLLESRTQVPIYSFNPSTGIDFTVPAQYVDFSAIDVDSWAQVLFSAIDQLLAPPSAAAIQQVDSSLGTAYYADLRQSREQLADIVQHWLQPVFQDAPPANVTTAREVFRQALRGQLSYAYATSAVVQFAAAGAAETPFSQAVRLRGHITRNFRLLGAVPAATDPSKLHLYFSAEPHPDVAVQAASYSAAPGLVVESATPDPANRRKVTLGLSGPVVVGTTQVTLAQPFSSLDGHSLLPPLPLIVAEQVQAGNYLPTDPFTPATLDLQPATTAPLAFLLALPPELQEADSAVIPFLDADLRFVPSQVEQPAKLDPDHEAPAALTFLTTAGANDFGADFGKFSIPLPLRRFPAAPALVVQQGTASEPAAAGSTPAADLLNWDYSLRYTTPLHFPQDLLSFTIHFNGVSQPPLLRAAPEDVFAGLAGFITVFPEVSQALDNALPEVSAVPAKPNALGAAAVALGAFNQLVRRILAGAATPRGLSMRAAGPEASGNLAPYGFDLTESLATIDGTEALVVSLRAAPAAGITVPAVVLDECSTHAYEGAEGHANTYSFYFRDAQGAVVSAVTGQQISSRTIILPRLNILQYQGVQMLVECQRNPSPLVGRPLTEAFVYRSGPVPFAEQLYPGITLEEPLELSTLQASAAEPNTSLPLLLHLTNLFDFLLAHNTQPTLSLKLSCTYAYELLPGIDTTLPVFLQLLTLVQVGAHQPLIAAWAETIRQWHDTNQPSATGAALLFDLELYSNLTQQPLPLLHLPRLSLQTMYIKGL